MTVALLVPEPSTRENDIAVRLKAWNTHLAEACAHICEGLGPDQTSRDTARLAIRIMINDHRKVVKALLQEDAAIKADREPVLVLSGMELVLLTEPKA